MNFYNVINYFTFEGANYFLFSCDFPIFFLCYFSSPRSCNWMILFYYFFFLQKSRKCSWNFSLATDLTDFCFIILLKKLSIGIFFTFSYIKNFINEDVNTDFMCYNTINPGNMSLARIIFNFERFLAISRFF